MKNELGKLCRINGFNESACRKRKEVIYFSYTLIHSIKLETKGGII